MTPPNDSDVEIKYLFPATATRPVLDWLRACCQPDPLYPEALVSSIYFDTLTLTHWREKANSDFFKTKLRIRWYRDPRDHAANDAAWIEAKFKIGSRRCKLRQPADWPVQRLARLPLESPAFGQMTITMRRMGAPVCKPLFPTVEIRYRRHRFIEPVTGSRCCLDSAIGAVRVNRRLLAAAGPWQLPLGVFEIKGPTAEVPVNLKRLASFRAQRASFSKYGTCIERLLLPTS